MVYRRLMKDISRRKFARKAIELGCTHFYSARTGVYGFVAPYEADEFIAFDDEDELTPAEKIDAFRYARKIPRNMAYSPDEIAKFEFIEMMKALRYDEIAEHGNELTIAEMVDECEKCLAEYYTRGNERCEMRYSGVRKINLQWWKEKIRLENYIKSHRGR